MMKCYILWVGLTLMACSDTTLKGENLAKASNLKEEKQMATDSIKFSDLMQLKAQEAMVKYGKPIKRERFVLDDLQGEFRNGISDRFTLEERLSESIVIEELTWEKDQHTFITVWYQELPKGLIPKEQLTWDKGAEF